MLVQESWECFTVVCPKSNVFDTQTCQQHNSVTLHLDFSSNSYELSWFGVVCVFLRMSLLFSEWRIRLFVLSVFWQSFPVTDTLVSLFVSVRTRVSTAPPVWIMKNCQERLIFHCRIKRKESGFFCVWKNNFTTINIFMHLDRVFMEIKLISTQHLWIFVNVSS